MTAMTKHDGGVITKLDEDSGQRGALTDVAKVRAMQEIQAMITVARQFPRNQAAAFVAIEQPCNRYAFAEKAMFNFPRGKKPDGKPNFVTGPSIRLAEALMQSWGSMRTGFDVVDRRGDQTTVRCFAWDLETNAISERTIIVPHTRDTRAGLVRLTDERDIYEAVANQASRRQRACILALLPSDYVAHAVALVGATMTRGEKGVSLADAIRKLESALLRKGVTRGQIETYLGHPIAQMTSDEVRDLTGVYNAIDQGAVSAADAFAVDVDDGDAKKKEPGPDLVGALDGALDRVGLDSWPLRRAFLCTVLGLTELKNEQALTTEQLTKAIDAVTSDKGKAEAKAIKAQGGK